MPDKNWQFELEEYIKQGEPERAEKSEAWQTAIGLQAVDGLKTSEYLLDTAKEHIEGKITIDEVVDWSKVDKEDYLLAMERSLIKDVEIKVLLKGALTDEINSREVYMKGIDQSYYYEGYTTFKTEEL